MGGWRNRGHWDFYSESRPRKVTGGIKTKSERGAIGETWWSKRWLQVLESFSMGSRLTRGRSYARQGQVLSIDIQAGIVRAKVQGSRMKPYDIQIRLKPLSQVDWDKVTEVMAAQALFAAKLLAGEMPSNIEEAFGAAHLSLFPTAEKELDTDCSCPDWANPCKHIAAVYYLLAEQFDTDPFLIFKLRGRTKEEIIATLREKRVEMQAEKTAPSSNNREISESGTDDIIQIEASLEGFWSAGAALDTFAVYPTSPTIDQAILKRLGDAPFTIGKQNITSLLSKAYDVVEEITLQKEQE